MPREHVVDADVDTGLLRPNGACVKYEKCGNTVPQRNKMCAECLQEIRYNDARNHAVP
jgi:hypothetical protein